MTTISKNFMNIDFHANEVMPLLHGTLQLQIKQSSFRFCLLNFRSNFKGDASVSTQNNKSSQSDQ